MYWSYSTSFPPGRGAERRGAGGLGVTVDKQGFRVQGSGFSRAHLIIDAGRAGFDPVRMVGGLVRGSIGAVGSCWNYRGILQARGELSL